ncbi:MAG: hypothetical protein J6B16_00845 [Clostridia bacterium]|nr:hypothetical protein [Clostridia bacterium]
MKMHKIYENDDLVMYFKKRYCHCCGNKLQKKTTERVVCTDDPEHRHYCHIGPSYKPHGDILVVAKEYYCPFCNKSFSCDKQSEIINAQKYYKRKIVTNEEISNIKNLKLQTAVDTILKMRWLLIIPFIGGLICAIKITNGFLSEKLEKNDAFLFTILPLIVFTCVAIIMDISIFKIDLINNYKPLIMLIMVILSSFLFNILILLLINKRFKK